MNTSPITHKELLETARVIYNRSFKTGGSLNCVGIPCTTCPAHSKYNGNKPVCFAFIRPEINFFSDYVMKGLK